MALTALQLTAFITPFLPLLLVQDASGTAATGQLNVTTDDDDWAQAQQIWQVLESVIQRKLLVIAVAAAIAEDILDEEAQAAFSKQVKELLAEDAGLEQR